MRFESVRTLTIGGHPDYSPVGIGPATASLIVMPFIVGQRRTGKALGSNAVVRRHPGLCTYLSAVLLVGLLPNATLGWGWADPLAGLVIAGVATRKASKPGRAMAAARPTR